MVQLKVTVKRIFWFIKDFFSLVYLRRGYVPLRYFSAKKNVGDALNPYLVSKITKKRVYETKSNLFEHILGVGSILHFASSKSIVWGSGIIDPTILPKIDTILQLKVTSLRGIKTKELLIEKGLAVYDCPLGDPAILMPLFYNPSVIKKFKVGVVPHYVDNETEVIEYLATLPGVCIIDVANSPEEFVDHLCQCETIISSSLHGLILSDAYKIPNIWAVFSDNILGGRFKFTDYYSTTNNSTPEPLHLLCVEDLAENLEHIISKAKVSDYSFDNSDLLASFPKKFL